MAARHDSAGVAAGFRRRHPWKGLARGGKGHDGRSKRVILYPTKSQCRCVERAV